MKSTNKTILGKYKDQLERALYHDYAYNLPRAVLDQFEKIYFEETGKDLRTNFSCSNCVLNLLKKVGKLYFETDGK